ncbi:MAG: branched-chain amino acid ABC transporter permease [Actinobacteria bacterium]|nr:branched-chain amino acid ABC transporter permease [Actinomycetota bacterium]
MSWDQILNLLISALFSIATLALISLGLAVVFGMMKIINLAHGEFLMLGAFATLTANRLGLPLWLSMVCAPVVVGVIGLVLERGIIRHLYGRIIDTMLATWGISLVLVQLVVIAYGPATQGLATPLGSFRLGNYSVSAYSLFLVAAAGGLVVLTYVLFMRTKYGLMARAASQLPQTASALGINAGRINMLTFAVGSALSGAAGALLAPVVGVVPSMGMAFIAKAFMTVIVGGPLVLSGAMSAAALLGSVDNVVSYLSTPFLGQGALLVISIVLLRLMPNGLSGKWRRQL